MSARTGPRSSGAKTAPSPRARRCGGTRYACTRTRLTGMGEAQLGQKDPSLHAPTGMCGWVVVGGEVCCFRGRPPFIKGTRPLSPSPHPARRPARARCAARPGRGPPAPRARARGAGRDTRACGLKNVSDIEIYQRLATKSLFMSRLFLLSSHMGCAYRRRTHTKLTTSHLCMHTRMAALSRPARGRYETM